MAMDALTHVFIKDMCALWLNMYLGVELGDQRYTHVQILYILSTSLPKNSYITKKVRQVLSGGGYKERVKESEYGGILRTHV
jgi:hypothetical protein